jgi:hypothetical protein
MGKIWTDGNRRVEVCDFEDTSRVGFYAVGGGPLCSLPREEFHDIFHIELMQPRFRLALVSGDWLEHEDENKRLPCYTDGSRWNGWAKPHFSKEQVLEMMALDPSGMFEGTTYDAEKDAFIYDPEWREEQGVDIAVWPGQDIETADGVKHLYEVGDGWCWDFVQWLTVDPKEG